MPWWLEFLSELAGGDAAPGVTKSRLSFKTLALQDH